ncbi:MAG TPA: dTDP-4-dehydrorhamnose 3,5-epimerase [Thermoanaerobaculia bacterium]|nr:dTDP-4-dehydrorhamnose 3,5-epimerase [Thermoanaerobaculia bacterium]
MRFLETELSGVVVIEPTVYSDARGSFMETFNAAEFEAAGIAVNFVQDNHSQSVRGVLRGLHYQEPNPQGKLVRVTEGTILDVAVNIDPHSTQFGRWTGVELSAENTKQLWVPQGFAHGFCVLSEQAQVIYKCTALYDPGSERCIRWDDEEIGIGWPVKNPLLSPKDLKGRSLRQAVAISRS